MPTQFTSATPILRMFDIRKAREFYLDFLGFKVDFEHRFEPDLPLYMGLSLGSVVLHLSEHHGDCAPGARVIIETTGLAEYQARLLAKPIWLCAARAGPSALGRHHHDRDRPVLQRAGFQRA